MEFDVDVTTTIAQLSDATYPSENGRGIHKYIASDLLPVLVDGIEAVAEEKKTREEKEKEKEKEKGAKKEKKEEKACVLRILVQMEKKGVPYAAQVVEVAKEKKKSWWGSTKNEL